MKNEQTINLNKKIRKCMKEIEEIIINTNISDQRELTDTVIKVQVIYEKYSDSESLASYYISTLSLLVESQRNLEDINGTVSKASDLYQKFPNSEFIANGYISILVKLYEHQESLQDKRDTVSKIHLIYSNFPDSKLLSYYTGLIGFRIPNEFCNAEIKDMEDNASKVYRIYQKFPNSEEIAKSYAIALEQLALRQYIFEDIKDNVSKLHRIYQKFPNSEEIAKSYAITLGQKSLRQYDFEDERAIIYKIYEIYQKFPNSVAIAEQYVFSLRYLAYEQEILEDIQGTISKIYSIYQKFPNSVAIAKQYAFSLGMLANEQEILEDIQDTVTKIYNIHQNCPDSFTIAEQYAFSLERLAEEQEILEDIQDTVLQVCSIYQKFPYSKRVNTYYCQLYHIFCAKLKNIEDIQDTVTKIHNIYQNCPKSEELALGYVSILTWLSKHQEILDDIQDTVVKVYETYQKFPNSEEIAQCYASVLERLANEQEILEDIQDTASKVYCIYQKFPSSSKVLTNIAGTYLIIIKRLSEKQESLEEIEKSIVNALNIYQRFSDLHIYEMLLASIIYEYINKFLLNTSQQQPDEINHKFKILLSWLTNANTETIVAILDYIFSPTNHFIDLTNYRAKIMSRLLIHFSSIVSLQQTKYVVLVNLLRGLENTDCEIENLIIIYFIIQIIKFQLSIKDLSNIDFGHYTSGEVLQILLKQSSDSQKEYSIEGRTRLGNVKYMNDPEEGSVLDRYLGLGEVNNIEPSLKPSPWFLMSLTTAIDDLAMWSQYGARAKGVCLVFKSDSFEIVNSIAETEWMAKKNDITIMDKKLDYTYKKDFLYRICYLDEESLNSGDLNVVKKDNNNMLDRTEISTINKCLEQIKSIVSKIEEKTLLYSAVEECLEEIRYLFKASGYSYESELRILKYADLNPDNKEIKIDNSGPVAKLYLERDMPVQLKQVIFGPKFSNPEHVTPLLQLLDKDINFKRSDRKFK